MSKKPANLSSPSRGSESALLRTGAVVPESGIYRVHHGGHRLPHEVTLLKDQRFPRCAKCRNLVEFEIIALAPALPERPGRIVLYELPELDRVRDWA